MSEAPAAGRRPPVSLALMVVLAVAAIVTGIVFLPLGSSTRTSGGSDEVAIAAASPDAVAPALRRALAAEIASLREMLPDLVAGDPEESTAGGELRLVVRLRLPQRRVGRTVDLELVLADGRVRIVGRQETRYRWSLFDRLIGAAYVPSALDAGTVIGGRVVVEAKTALAATP